jgi:hypothetical protein
MNFCRSLKKHFKGNEHKTSTNELASFCRKTTKNSTVAISGEPLRDDCITAELKVDSKEMGVKRSTEWRPREDHYALRIV